MSEETALRWVAYAAFVAGAAGLALTLGGWVGWLVVLLAGAVPGVILLRKLLDRIESERNRASAPVAEPWRGPTTAFTDDGVPTSSITELRQEHGPE